MIENLTNNHNRTEFPYGFHLSRDAWDSLGLLDSLGDVDFIRRARALEARANTNPKFRPADSPPMHTGEILAYGLLSDILRFMARHYCAQVNPRIITQAMDSENAPDVVNIALRSAEVFVETLPPLPILKAETSVKTFLESGGEALPNRDAVLLELVLLNLAMDNPAVQPYRCLHDDTSLNETHYKRIVSYLETVFAEGALFPGSGMSLMHMLRAPMQASPYSLEGQLGFVAERWKALLPEDLLVRLYRAQDVMHEESKMRGFGPGLAHTPTFDKDMPGYEEVEAFSHDKAWMPNLMLLAKSTYVWLDQLSKKHKRDIYRLDHIPDEELDMLARWGFSGLWLIGLWERSVASKEIKRRMGNSEAEASAYSLYDYDIAQDLGGEAAYRDLAARAWKRGIRLASDMVPNHFGIYSHWVVNHPEWFVQTQYPPFPSYKFNGPDISPDDRVGLWLEDGYWNHSDAAVVFKWQNKATKEVRYIYHGNDGTNMPWNDTAQLNFLIYEVREAVIQTILHVAHMFPIIRFDAAMTLAKQHYQRLWFPAPGKGGDIPSRAEHGLSRMQFDKLFPKEFWREVVDRVAQEAPDTLLLAEAFWLMEGYFVRTLGMHRVYNSAFMNMLKLEENNKYRQTIKNVLEFSPEILQRFVNFMNNPDEDTAEAQFGKDDKYIGVCTLMITLPGLPMFGHGQVEGFSEKYGMEYRRAYKDEVADSHLVTRHEKEIFPLIRRRHLFSGSKGFAFFDFEHADGGVDENVFAYTNRSGAERALIVYHNSYDKTRGSLRKSTTINLGSAQEPHMIRHNLAESLDLNCDERCYYVCRDQRRGLDYLFYAGDLAGNGLYLELTEYQCCVFLDWQEIIDTDLSWARLHGQLKGRGTPNLWEAYQELNLNKILEPFEALLRLEMLDIAFGVAAKKSQLDLLFTALENFYAAVAMHVQSEIEIKVLCDEIRTEFEKNVQNEPDADKTEGMRRIFAMWILFRKLGRIAHSPNDSTVDSVVESQSATWMRQWFLTRRIAEALQQWGLEADVAWREARLVPILMLYRDNLLTLQSHSWGPAIASWLHDADVCAYLEMNSWQGRHYLNKEAWSLLLENLLWGLAWDKVLTNGSADSMTLAQDDIQTLIATAADVGYDRDALVDAVK